MTIKNGSVTYRPDIDGMRAVAVLLVLVFHFDLMPFAGAGFVGVDVFFVISGFLITSIVKRQLDDGTFSLRDFYAARIRRLAPALFVVLGLVVVAGAFTLFPYDLMELARQVMLAQVYVVNIYYWRVVNYFGLGTDNVFLLHTWSLAVEEQFYLFYPLALVLLHRFLRRQFWGWVAGALVVSFALNLAFVASKPEATFYLLPTRAWELLAGALIFRVAGWRTLRGRSADLAGAVGALCLVVSVVAYTRSTAIPGAFIVWPVAGACCLLWAGEGGGALVTRALGGPSLVYVGKISYPLYLVHWPVNVFASRQLGSGYDLAWRLAMFFGSCLLAALIFHLVEQPVRARKVFRERRGLVLGYGSGLVVSFGAVLAIHLTGGLPQRFPAEVSRLAAYAEDKSPPLAQCEFTGKHPFRADDLCRIGAPGATARWLVYGDSHAWAAHAAFDKWLLAKGEAGFFMYRHSCPPIVGVHLVGERVGCYEFNQAIATFVASSSTVDSVVLVSSWYEAPEGALTNDSSVRLSKSESIALFERAFTETIATYARSSKRVYVWAPVPGATRSVPIAMARALLDGSALDVEISYEQYLGSTAFFWSAIQANRPRIAAVFSPADALCSNGRCAATIDGNPAYFDNSHVTRSSADFWAAMLRRTEVAGNK